MNLRSKLEKYPPCLMRLLARAKNGEAMSSAAIEQVVGDRALFLHLSFSPRWDNHRIEHLWLWMRATGCDIEDRAIYRRLSRYMNPDRGSTFCHLKRSDEWPELKKVLATYLQSLPRP